MTDVAVRVSLQPESGYCVGTGVRVIECTHARGITGGGGGGWIHGSVCVCVCYILHLTGSGKPPLAHLQTESLECRNASKPKVSLPRRLLAVVHTVDVHGYYVALRTTLQGNVFLNSNPPYMLMNSLVLCACGLMCSAL